MKAFPELVHFTILDGKLAKQSQSRPFDYNIFVRIRFGRRFDCVDPLLIDFNLKPPHLVRANGSNSKASRNDRYADTQY